MVNPRPKVLSLWLWLVDKFSNEGDIILDPMIGSGTTAVACHRLKRRFIGMEIDETSYKLTCNRLEDEQMQLRMELT